MVHILEVVLRSRQEVIVTHDLQVLVRAPLRTAGNMCNLRDWLPDAIPGNCGADTGSACVIEDVLAVLLGGR